jgi:hypothetical protein
MEAAFRARASPSSSLHLCGERRRGREHTVLKIFLALAINVFVLKEKTGAIPPAK